MTARLFLLSGLGGFAALGMVAYFTWAIWIARYVQRYGMKPAFFLSLWAPLVDYQRAKLITRKVQAVPWFLKFFQRISWLALGFILTGAVGAGICWILQR